MTASTVNRSAAPAGERRLVIAAFLSLFGILCAQSLLETARDTLFLTHVSVGLLPWLYLAMAATTLVITWAAPRPRGRTGVPGVSLSLLVGAAVTAALAVALGGAGRRPAVYVLFLWSGIFAAFSVTQVWMVLADALDMSFAKRLYGRLAAGGGLGAVTGAALARLLGDRIEPRQLVLLAAVIAAATALGPGLALWQAGAAESARPAPRPTAGRTRAKRMVAHPYVTRLLVIALLGAAVSTLLDFSLKEAVAAHLSVDRLPRFFATFHLVTSGISLIVQVFGVALLVRIAGVGRVQVALPVLLLAAVAATVVTGGLAAVVLLRGFEASLRSAFHRPSFELLQVPLADRIRRKAKPMIDAFGQRGGQAIAALALLLMLRVAAGPTARFGLTIVLLAVWLIVAVGLGRRYVDLLRSALLRSDAAASSDGALRLDAAANGALVAALDSPREQEVEAAVNLLGAYGATLFIPPRLLDHPSPLVVRRVVEFLPLPAPGGPTVEDGLLGRVARLLSHPDVTVRKAALRRLSGLGGDMARVRRLAADARCPTIRAMALVVIIDGGCADADVVLPELLALVDGGDLELRSGVAEAIADRPSPSFEQILVRLADAQEAVVLAPVASTLGALGGPAATAALVGLLGKREARAPARVALARLGTAAFEAVAAALADVQQPRAVRANAARALVEIDAARAMRVLSDGLLVERDGYVRFRILRALNRSRRAQRVARLDEDVLARAAVAAAESAYRYLAWRIFLEEGATRRVERRTPTWGLLGELLQEKEQNAVERLFRVLTLRYPRENFRKVLRALRVGSRRRRATGRELIESLLTGPAQALTLALIDDLGDRERLMAMEKANPTAVAATAPAYRDLLDAICAEEDGGTLAALAALHLAELTAPLSSTSSSSSTSSGAPSDERLEVAHG